MSQKTYFNPSTEQMREILTELGFKLNDEGKDWRCAAIHRDGDNERGIRINKITGVWQDFSVGEFGSFFQLVGKAKGFKNKTVKQIIEAIESEQRNNHSEVAYPLEKISCPKIFDPSLLDKLKQDHSYWINRGVKEETIKLFKGGLCTSGNMNGRYVFPIFDENSIIRGFSGRAVYDNPKIKWKHFGSKTTWEYPLFASREEVEKEGFVVIIESIGDMLRLWDNGVKNTLVTFGLDGLSNIKYKLLELDPQKISISFNDDNVGAKFNGKGNEASVRFARDLVFSQLFEREQIKILPPSSNDFGVMTDEQIQLWHQKTKKKLLT